MTLGQQILTFIIILITSIVLMIEDFKEYKVHLFLTVINVGLIWLLTCSFSTLQSFSWLNTIFSLIFLAMMLISYILNDDMKKVNIVDNIYFVITGILTGCAKLMGVPTIYQVIAYVISILMLIIISLIKSKEEYKIPYLTAILPTINLLLLIMIIFNTMG